MSTVTAANREMVESKGVELFQFSQQHPSLSGYLLKIEKTAITDKQSGEVKEAVQYVIGIEGDDLAQIVGAVTFLQTYDLSRKLLPKHVGHYVTVKLEGEKDLGRNNQNKMQMFKVMTSKEQELNADMVAVALNDCGIFAATDADVAF